MDTTAEVIESPLIQKLKGDETLLLRTLSDLSTRYGDRHPDILKLNTELDDLRAKIHEEMGTIVESMRNEVSVAKARVDALQNGIDEIVQNRHQEEQAMIHLGELDREAKSNKLIFDTFLQTYKKSDEQEDLQEAEARVLSYAVAPSRPSYPDKMLLLSLASALSLFVGLGLAFLLEKLDNTFRSAGQLEKVGHFPCFALIPEVDTLKSGPTADFIISKPSSTAAESVRTLRTVINLRASTPERPKVVTITSSLPGEGKSTLAGWLARLAAKSGERVILIDADLRRPSIHRAFGASNEVSIVEYLTGKIQLKDAIQKDSASGLHILYGKSVPNSALDLVTSQKMSDMVAALREAYDLVIIDSPACLAVSDARVLARLSDQTLYAVSWDKTPREIVMGGVKQFSDMGYGPLAFVLTNVNVNKHVRYGYGDTVYYYGRYKEDE
ncbi:MAG: polysaccharide biosynthesis tyrosine autokinase [Alphaproteobacteria bacterium]|nr:polysaccharide biosynthesis tyrosine autokinase [Alphaproteobacteria bacterium]